MFKFPLEPLSESTAAAVGSTEMTLQLEMQSKISAEQNCFVNT